MSRKAKILTVKAIDAAISTIKKAERDSLELGDGHAPGLILTLRRGAQGLGVPQAENKKLSRL